MKKRIAALTMVAMLVMPILTGCGKTTKSTETEVKTLAEHSLMIYCGAGMTEPFQKIADAFQEETGCEMKVTFANAGQIQSQITTSEEGDMFIAGSQEEVEPIKDYVAEQKPLVKHIPVLAVAKGNPKEINGIMDLAGEGISFIMGDAESTPIGKIAKKALTEAGIFDKVTIEATTTTAPQLATAIGAGEADGAILWKENSQVEGVEIVNTTDMDPYIKKIPAVTLSCAQDLEALQSFNKYLDGENAKEIWMKFGYEITEE